MKHTRLEGKMTYGKGQEKGTEVQHSPGEFNKGNIKLVYLKCLDAGHKAQVQITYIPYTVIRDRQEKWYFCLVKKTLLTTHQILNHDIRKHKSNRYGFLKWYFSF